MEYFNTIAESVLNYIDGLDLSGKILLLSTFTQLSITEKEGKYHSHGEVKDIQWVKDTIAIHIRWLRMSEIDNIYKYITK